MVDETIGETIATNLVPDPRLTHVIPGGVNVVQAVLSGGMGVSLERGAGSGDSYVTPWAGAERADGDRVGVLIVQSNALEPYNGVSMDVSSGAALVWLRGASTGYAEVMAVRCQDPSRVRLRAPRSGVLTVIKSGVFDMDSWTAMQERGIIYFDGGGIVQAAESGYTLPPATTTTLGGVIVGEGLTVSAQGVLSVLRQDVPIATQDTAGVVKVGQGLRAASDGTITVRLGDNLEFDSSGNINATTESQQVDLSDYYDKAQSDARYPTKELADATYATKDSLNDLQTDLTALENKVDGMGSGGGSDVDLNGYAEESWVTNNFLRKNDYVEYEVQSGSYTYGNLAANGYADFNVSFNHQFGSIPVVQAGTNQAAVICTVATANSSRFTCTLHNTQSGSVSVTVNWSAIGEKR